MAFLSHSSSHGLLFHGRSVDRLESLPPQQGFLTAQWCNSQPGGGDFLPPVLGCQAKFPQRQDPSLLPKENPLCSPPLQGAAQQHRLSVHVLLLPRHVLFWYFSTEIEIHNSHSNK